MTAPVMTLAEKGPDVAETKRCTNVVCAMLREQSDGWALQRRYRQLEGLQTLSDTALARLPAVQR